MGLPTISSSNADAGKKVKFLRTQELNYIKNYRDYHFTGLKTKERMLMKEINRDRLQALSEDLPN